MNSCRHPQRLITAYWETPETVTIYADGSSSCAGTWDPLLTEQMRWNCEDCPDEGEDDDWRTADPVLRVLYQEARTLILGGDEDPLPPAAEKETPA